MIAAIALGHRRAAELAAVDDERVVEHAARFQVLDEGGGGLIDFAGAAAHVIAHGAVMVPVAMIELDEADAALGQAAGHQAVGAERAVGAGDAVVREGALRFVGEVAQGRHRGLHAEGHLVLGDARGDFGIIDDAVLQAIELLHRIDDVALPLGVDALRAGEVEDRIAGAAQVDALIARRQKARCAIAAGRSAAIGRSVRWR